MKQVPVAGILPIVFGVLVLFEPGLAPYFIGIYLILIGSLAIAKR